MKEVGYIVVFLAGILFAVVVLLFGMKAKDNVEEILMYANRNYDEDDIRWEWGYIMSKYHTRIFPRDTLIHTLANLYK